MWATFSMCLDLEIRKCQTSLKFTLHLQWKINHRVIPRTLSHSGSVFPT